jgi:hypothetical protein
MPIPDVTRLQFLVLAALLDGELTGKRLRERLADEGERKSLAAFYMFMSRLEDVKLVKGRYETKSIDGVTIKERVYELTGGGIAAVDDFRAFVLSRTGKLGIQGA